MRPDFTSGRIFCLSMFLEKSSLKKLDFSGLNEITKPILYPA
jgi:hypothetical protein